MMINTLVHSPYIVKQHLTHHTRAGSRRTLTAWMAKHRLPTGLFCFSARPYWFCLLSSPLQASPAC